MDKSPVLRAPYSSYIKRGLHSRTISHGVFNISLKSNNPDSYLFH